MANLAEKIKAYLEQNGKDWKNHLYFDGDIIIQNASDGTGDKITQWNVGGLAKPTTEQLDALESQANELKALNQVYANRKAEYPTIEELVVALYDTDDKAAIDAKRAEVKAKYSKP